MLPDYYQILGVSQAATLEEIKKAYRSKAKLCHPDINSSPESNQLFILLNEAHKTLSDELKKNLYDLKLKYRIKDNYYKYGNSKSNQYGQNKSTNSVNFHYDWDSFNKLRQQKKYKVTRWSKIAYVLFAVLCMFIGFITILIVVILTYTHLWPRIFLLISIPGIMIVEECWYGLTNKKSVLKRVWDWINKFFSKP